MPQAYLATLKRVTAQAATRQLGIEESNTSRIAYWVDGRTLGTLSCKGSSDEDGKINGRGSATRHTGRR
jgi:hypothetical protein